MEKHTIHQKIGLAPGTLIYTGSFQNEPVSLEFIQYKDDTFSEQQLENYDPEKVKPNAGKVNWINLIGLHQEEMIARLGLDFNINNLALEDALNVHELPKSEEFEEQLFITLKMLYYDDAQRRVRHEHISLILGEDYVITLQEHAIDVFEGLRNRIRTPHGKIRTRGNDYLMYALLDSIVDHYFIVLSELGKKIEHLEETIIDELDKDVLNKINALKKELIGLKKFILPLELAIQQITKYESRLVSESISHFYEDLKNHLAQISHMMNEQRDTLTTLMDLHISLLSNEMNQIMKVLTIVAAIFIPLTFLAGIYGMNFEYMPELSYRWGYPVLLGVMGILTVLLIVYLKKKRWL